MTLDRFARRFLDLARASAPEQNDEASVDDMRRTTAMLASFALSERKRGVETRDAKLAGGREIPIRLYAPISAAAQSLPGLIYFHGGGWLSGDLNSHDGLCRALSDEGQCRVIAVDYRLAPEHRFPAALDDGFAAVKEIVAEAQNFKIDPRRIGIAGDSAGGNLAAVLNAQLRKSEIAIALQVLLCPVLDALGRTPSRAALASGYFLQERTMVRYFDCYRIDGLEPDDPKVSPVRAADFHDLPPTRVHVAEYDPLKDEASLYVEKLVEAGVDARVTIHPGMIHHFYGLGDIIPYAREALKMIGADIREAFS
jgi:acetyl esterase/lipase